MMQLMLQMMQQQMTLTHSVMQMMANQNAAAVPLQTPSMPQQVEVQNPTGEKLAMDTNGSQGCQCRNGSSGQHLVVKWQALNRSWTNSSRTSLLHDSYGPKIAEAVKSTIPIKPSGAGQTLRSRRLFHLVQWFRTVATLEKRICNLHEDEALRY